MMRIRRRPAPRPDARRPEVRRAAVEALEDRRLLSVSLLSPGAGGSAAAAPDGALGVTSRVLGASDDGRFVLFASDASDLVAGDANGVADLFVRDTKAGTTTLVSVAAGGGTGAGESGLVAGDDTRGAAISGNGRFVVFASAADDLVANDANGGADVFLRDLTAGTTALVTVNAAGTASATNAGENAVQAWGTPAVSDDGRFVAFGSTAANLVANQEDDGDAPDTFVRDLGTGTTVQLSNAVTSEPSSSDSTTQSMSADGRFVAFATRTRSAAAVPEGTAPSQVYLYDTSTGQTTVASVAPDGTTPGDGDSVGPKISGDGRVLVWRTRATNLVAGMTRGAAADEEAYDLVRRDLTTGATTLVSHAAGSATTGGNDRTGAANLSEDGRFVTYYSLASDLASVADANSAQDAFLYDAATGVNTVLSTAAAGGATADLGAAPSPGGEDAPAISASGRFVVFGSFSTDIDAADVPSNLVPGLFRRDAQDNSVRRLLLDQNGPGGTPVSSNAATPVATDDGVIYFAADGAGLPGQLTTTTGYQVYADGLAGGDPGPNPNPDGPVDVVPAITASLPAAVVGGQKAKASASVVVTNGGTGLLNGKVTVTLYASTDAAVDAGDAQLLTVTKKLKLKAGKAKTLKLKIKSFPAVADGAYFVVASVAGADGVTDANTANNVVASANQVTIAAPFVDLATAAGIAPAPVRAGKSTTLLLDVANAGNVTASGTATAQVTLTPAAGQPVTVNVPVKLKLSPGMGKRYKLKLGFPEGTPAGDYSALVNLDASGLGDANVANNLAGPVTVSVTA
ncbi:MAG TPA: hypothetical protein VF796_16265 [Humisphaera sp.]